MFTLGAKFNRFIFMATNREIYDSIAESWYGYRHHTRFKKHLDELGQRWQKGKLLNLGCGHGPDFLPFKNGFDLHGLDFSANMIRQALRYARKYDFDAGLLVADLAHLPYRADSFDWAISVAAYHHIRDRKDRLAALSELKRVLKPGAEAFITVWNRGQPGFWLKGKKTLVDWKTKAKVYQRYYYLYTYAEFEKDVRQSGLQIIDSGPEKSYSFPLKYFSRNICLLVKKP
jgi:tRNA (uracil-5-)-methyltransferase TRM9